MWAWAVGLFVVGRQSRWKKSKHVSQLTSSSLYLKPKFRTVLMYFKFLFISLSLFFYIKFDGSVRLDGSGGSAVCWSTVVTTPVNYHFTTSNLKSQCSAVQMQVFVVYMLFKICYWSSIGLIYKELLKFVLHFPEIWLFFFTQVLKFDRLLNCVLVKLSLCDLER